MKRSCPRGAVEVGGKGSCVWRLFPGPTALRDLRGWRAQPPEFDQRSREGLPARGLLRHSAAPSCGRSRPAGGLGSDPGEGKRVGCEGVGRQRTSRFKTGGKSGSSNLRVTRNTTPAAGVLCEAIWQSRDNLHFLDFWW